MIMANSKVDELDSNRKNKEEDQSCDYSQEDIIIEDFQE